MQQTHLTRKAFSTIGPQASLMQCSGFPVENALSGENGQNRGMCH